MNPKDSNVYSKWIGQGLSDPEGGRMFDNNRQKVQKHSTPPELHRCG